MVLSEVLPGTVKETSMRNLNNHPSGICHHFRRFPAAQAADAIYQAPKPPPMANDAAAPSATGRAPTSVAQPPMTSASSHQLDRRPRCQRTSAVRSTAATTCRALDRYALKADLSYAGEDCSAVSDGGGLDQGYPGRERFRSAPRGLRPEPLPGLRTAGVAVATTSSKTVRRTNRSWQLAIRSALVSKPSSPTTSRPVLNTATATPEA